nr:uncharacterized protein LOC126523532 [Dermacentor andersoni]
MDANNGSTFECLSARRVDIDPKTKTATYIWSLAGDDGKGRKKVPFYHMPADSPDVTLYTVGSKSSPVESGRILYTDYKNCAIADFAHFGDECTLWVAYEVRDSIPTACLEQYSDICGEAVSVNDIDACEDAYA